MDLQIVSLIATIAGSVGGSSFYLGRRIGSFQARLKTVENVQKLYSKEREQLLARNGKLNTVIDEIHQRLAGIEALMKK